MIELDNTIRAALEPAQAEVRRVVEGAMSVCECPWGNDETIGTCFRGPHIARTVPQTKRGNGDICAVCKHRVAIGARCYDFTGIRADQGGWFYRMHAECVDLMQRFADKVCGGEWAVPFDLEGASNHALAHGDEPYWKEWLLLYEKTWAFGE